MVKTKEEFRERKNTNATERRIKEPLRTPLNQARSRAKKQGIPFDISLDDLFIPDECPVFKIPLFFTPGKRTHNSYSIDRVDNNKGYTVDNTRVISLKANQRKSDLTIEEVEQLLKYMKGEL